MNDKVSIIIPVYNVEKYIATCVKSLLNQTHNNIEIILVDDGTPDSSGKICDELKESDNRIVVIHKENGGVSSARNVGIEYATGNYLCYADGDDYVSVSYIKDMLDVAVATNADIITSNAYKIWDNGEKIELFAGNTAIGEYVLKTGSESLSDMLYGKTCSASCWGKLFKRDIFESIRFPHISLGEDSYTMYHCFLKANKIAHLHKPNYYYLQHTASALHTNNYDKFYDYIELSDNFMDIINNVYPELFLPAVNRLIENNFWVYMKMCKNPDRYEAQLKHIVDNIKTYRKHALKDENVCFRTRMACLISYGGMGLLKFVYKIKK